LDYGTPIQSLLSTINPNAAQNVFANFVGYGPYNFYALFAPTGSNTYCDTAFILDLHTRQWYVWKFADQMLTSIFYFSLKGTPRWLTFSADGTCRYFDPTLVMDKQGEGDQASIVTQIQTSWLSFGDPALRKLVNSLEVLTVDPNMTITVEAAQTTSDFNSPKVLVSNSPLTQDIFGQFKVMLTTQDTLSRFFRVTFNTSSNAITSTVNDNLLELFSASFVPLNRI
jgi:hypothetical protein